MNEFAAARRRSARRVALCVPLLLAVLAVGVRPAGATHFFGTATSWQRDFTFTTPGFQRIVFQLDGEWRSSFPWPGGANPPVGQTLLSLYTLNVSGTGYSNSVGASGLVTEVNLAEDRMRTRSTVTLDVPTSAFPITMLFQGCCRISSLAEGNNDQSYQLNTVVDTAKASRSPQYTGPFHVHLVAGQPASYALSTLGFLGLSNSMSIAPSASSLLPFPRPVGIAACTAGCNCFGTDAGQCANGLSLSPTNVVGWTPQVAGVYGVQFALTSVDASNVPKASVPVDMILHVQQPCPTCPLVIAPATASAAVGTPLSVPVSVTWSGSGTVSLLQTGLPVAELLGNQQPPYTVPLQWTPGAGDVGLHTVCFQAQSNGNPPVGSVGETCTAITVNPPACAAGTYSVTGSQPCTPCPAGMFTDGPGQTACAQCSVCGSGEFITAACTATADIACGACDASCTQCNGPTATNCTSCPNGAAPVGGACLPDLCAAGTASATGREPCTACPAGFVSTTAGQSTCTPCVAGTIAADPGQTQCDACAPGTFAASLGGSVCEPCGSCPANGFEATACTATADTVCGACDASCTTCGGPTPADCTSCPPGEPLVAGVCTVRCTSAPATGCRPPAVGGKSKLDIKDNADDAKDGLKWKWQKGSATTVADFGDPRTTDGWYLCLYDGTTRVSTAALPAGGTCGGKPCWSAKSTGFAYKNSGLTPDGVLTAALKAGVAEQAAIGIVAKGAHLDTPNPTGFVGPIRVQLQRADHAICFEDVFSAPFKKNAGGSFSDASDVGVTTTSSSTAAPTAGR